MSAFCAKASHAYFLKHVVLEGFLSLTVPILVNFESKHFLKTPIDAVSFSRRQSSFLPFSGIKDLFPVFLAWYWGLWQCPPASPCPTCSGMPLLQPAFQPRGWICSLLPAADWWLLQTLLSCLNSHLLFRLSIGMSVCISFLNLLVPASIVDRVPSKASCSCCPS